LRPAFWHEHHDTGYINPINFNFVLMSAPVKTGCIASQISDNSPRHRITRGNQAVYHAIPERTLTNGINIRV